MKTRHLLLVAVLSVSAVASAQGPALKAFCDDPYKVICGEHLQEKQRRDERLRLRIEEVKTEAWNHVLQTLPKAKMSEIPLDDLDGDHPKKKKKLTARQEKIARLYFEGVNQALKKRIGGAFTSYQPLFAKIRQFFVEMVKVRVQREQPDDAQKMLAGLQEANIEFIDALEVLGSASSKKNSDLLREVVQSCGETGLADNAFAFQLDGKNRVVLCPGDYLAIYEPSSKGTISSLELAGEIWTLGHEMGHHIDAREFPSSFQKLEGCVADNYLAELGELDENGLRENLKRDQVTRYMGEISADYWGTEALAETLKTVKNETRRLYIIQDSLESLCDSRDDGSDGGHPEGRFRIENFLRRNPRFSQIVGCEPNAAISFKPSCTLRGAWRKRFW